MTGINASHENFSSYFFIFRSFAKKMGEKVGAVVERTNRLRIREKGYQRPHSYAIKAYQKLLFWAHGLVIWATMWPMRTLQALLFLRIIEVANFWRFNLMEPFMRYSLFTTSSCTQHPHSAIIGNVITTIKIKVILRVIMNNFKINHS